jgi:hypothetical protein
VKQVPIHYLRWLVSRASGIVAILLVSVSVLMGLAMATKVLRRPGAKRAVARLHEHIALVALAASSRMDLRCSAIAGCGPACAASRCRSR